MDFGSVFVDMIWTTLTGLVPLIVPFCGVLIVFKILADLLFRDRS